MKQLWGFLLLAIILATPVYADDLISIPHLGFHPSEDKYALIYTLDTSGTATLSDGTSIVLTTPTSSTGTPIGCQGNTNCLVADLSGVAPGTYTLSYGTQTSAPFTIASTNYASTLPLYLEWFNAHMMQDSSYHGVYFGSETPQYTMMADGAHLMEANQAAIALTRIANAYNNNPTGLQADTYDVLEVGEVDAREYIRAHVDYLRSLQTYNARSNDYDVVKGYTRPWGDWLRQDPALDWHTASSPSWINFDTTINNEYTTQTAYAYLMALPAIEEQSVTDAEELLQHTLDTMTFIEGFSMSDEAATWLGAAYFRAYVHTGDWNYLDKAYALRPRVDQTIYSDNTRPNEFYWTEYIRHENEIILLGYDYSLNGADPLDVLRGKLYFDYKDRGGYSMDQTAERIFEFDRNIQFSNSRFILLEGIWAAKAREFDQDPLFDEIATSQMAWMTGRNAVQHYDQGNNLRSVSFIHGIGKYTAWYHSRITPGSVKLGQATFANGMTHIPGWVNGAFDRTSDTDIIMNYREENSNYPMTETTNEMVALALELTALQDAYYNNVQPLPLNVILDLSTPWPNRPPYVPPEENNSNATCSLSLPSAVATCNGGTITSDVMGGCRTVVCDSATGTLSILACDKNLFFEMYNQGSSDPALEICLDSTCISDNGYAKSNDYLACGDPLPPVNATITVTLQVINDDNGTANESNVTIDFSGDTLISGVQYQYPPGPYVLSTNTLNGYSMTITGDCASDGSITLAEAQNALCLITYDDIGDTSCVASVEFMPATCSGTLTADSFGGCRALDCSGAAGSISVLACDKPNSNNPTHFEMYKTASSGIAPELCLGTVCLSNGGFAASPAFPICGTTPVCTDIDGDGYAREGGVCGAVDCNDGDALISPGAAEACNQIDDNCDGAVDEGGVCPLPVCGNSIIEYPETCDDGNTVNGDGCSDVCEIEINASVSLSIAPWFPQGQSYVFICDAQGLNPTRYDFDFGDGNQNNWRTTNDVYYTYAASGAFTVTCTAYQGTTVVQDTLDIVVS